MTTTRDPEAWSAFDEGMAPAAPHVGPFPHAPFLRAAEAAFDTDGEIAVVGDGAGAAAFVIESTGIRFAGPETITDYHAPLGDVATAMAEFLPSRGGMAFSFDSLPEEAVASVVSALDAVGATYVGGTHAATGMLLLPESTDAWLASLRKKERHEVRRKRRRYEAEFGPVAIQSAGIDGLDRFVALHRTASGDKGAFMTERMAGFFASLITESGARIHELVSEDSVVAAAFGFETDDAYFYYNSAYDTDAAHASPGIVLLTAMIDRQIERRAQVFDFLKGAESYKYRLGAHPRELTVVEGRLP